MKESIQCHRCHIWVMEKMQLFAPNNVFHTDTTAGFCWRCCRFPTLTYTLSPFLLADLKLFWYWNIPHLSVLSLSFCLPRYEASGSPPTQPCHTSLLSAAPHGCGHNRMLCLHPGLIHNIHNIHNIHYSTCCLSRKQTGFRSHVHYELIKIIAVALEENNHILIQNHRLTASLLFTCSQCHSHWKDPSWSEQKRQKVKKKKKLKP